MAPTTRQTSHRRQYTRYIWLLLPVILWILYFRSFSDTTINPDVLPIRSIPAKQRTCLATPSTKRIAIIGAGSAGTSAAYYLARAQASGDIDPCTNLTITIFERNSYIGGRSTTVHPYISRSGQENTVVDHISIQDIILPDSTIPALELGGSIFVKVNTNLLHAAEALNLSVSSAGSTPGMSIYSLGVWDGQSFRFLSKDKDSWWYELGKIFYRYGLSPLWTQRAMKSTVGQFLQMYKNPHFPWKNLTAVVEDVGLHLATGMSGRAFLEERGINAAFSEDIIQASTRVNYAQNLDQIHGLETMVCMAAEGAMSVKGGNWQIFAGMARDSGANVHLNTTVLSISSLSSGKDSRYAISYTSKIQDEEIQSNPQTEHYEHLILATPLQFSGIDTTSLSPSIQSILPEPISYVKLHVTLLATKHRLSPSFFSLASQDDVPEVILTTLPPTESSTKGPEFFSISTLRNLTHPATGEREYAYKIFSSAAPDAEFLSSLFGLPSSGDVDEEISWLYRHIWDSYPYLPPRTKFDGPYLAEGLWYTSGIESFISTMETSSLAGRNVARLIVEEINENAGKDMVGEEKDDI